MFNEWKTVRGLASCFGFQLEDMKRLRRYEGFPEPRCSKDGVRYNYYAFKDWLARYEAGEVKYISPDTVTPEEQKMRDEARTGKFFIDGKWIDMEDRK